MVHKPIGIKKKEYEEMQKIKAEDDFKSSTNAQIQNLVFAIDKINKSLNKSIGDHGSLKVEVKSMFDTMKTCLELSLKEFRQSIGDLETNINARNKSLDQLSIKSEYFINKADLKNEIDDLEKLIAKFNQNNETLRIEFNGMIQRQNIEFDNKLKALKEEILSTPSEIPNIKKTFDQKIEFVELNGQNALLRSSNNEKQIMLIERKIENIYQLIKKLEIVNQESS